MRTPLTLLVLGGVALAQLEIPNAIYDRTPNARVRIWGAESVKHYRLTSDLRSVVGPGSRVLARLPVSKRKAVPELLGMLRHGAEIELFLGWADPDGEEGAGHIEIFRGRQGSSAALVHEFTFTGGPRQMVGFFQPPDARDAPAVLIDIQGGAYWGTTYLLSADRRSAARLFDSSDYEFADLDRDGVYELIAWNRRPFDLRCSFGIFAVRFYPEVFVRAGEGFRKAWPPPDWTAEDGRLENHFRRHERDDVPWGANFQIVAAFADLLGGGSGELIVLQDRLLDKPAQTLAVYKLEKQSFDLVAQTSLPPQRIAYLLWGVRGQDILVRTATPAKCEAAGDPQGSGTGVETYRLNGDRLIHL